MPAGSPFSYAIVRASSRTSSAASGINVGVVVFCRPLDFLAARTALDETRARALAPALDLETVRGHLDGDRADRRRGRREPARSPRSTRRRASTGSSRRRARSSSRRRCTPASAAIRRPSSSACSTGSSSEPSTDTVGRVTGHLDRSATWPYEHGVPGAFSYARADHPTGVACEEALGLLDGGHALLYPAGMGAVTTVVLTLLRPGATIALAEGAYYGHKQLLDHLSSWEIEVVEFDQTGPPPAGRRPRLPRGAREPDADDARLRGRRRAPGARRLRRDRRLAAAAAAARARLRRRPPQRDEDPLRPRRRARRRHGHPRPRAARPPAPHAPARRDRRAARHRLARAARAGDAGGAARAPGGDGARAGRPPPGAPRGLARALPGVLVPRVVRRRRRGRPPRGSSGP